VTGLTVNSEDIAAGPFRLRQAEFSRAGARDQRL